MKLGSTNDPKRRIREYYTCHPADDDNACKMQRFFRPPVGKTATTIERCFAAIAKAHKTANEWYRGMTADDMSTILREHLDCTQIGEDECPRGTVDRDAFEYKQPDAYIADPTRRIEILRAEQEPMIEKLADFLRGPNHATTVIAPCGFGKSRVVMEAINRVNPGARVIVLAPTRDLCAQWSEMMLNAASHQACYANSCAIDFDAYDIIIADEGHHAAGIIDEGNGATKRFVLSNMRAKRIFMTFTPRYVRLTEDGMQNASMDNPAIFGQIIEGPSYLRCVNLGILPPYRITVLGGSHDDDELSAKIKQIARVWTCGARPMRRLVIYVARLADIDPCAEYLAKYANVPQGRILGLKDNVQFSRDGWDVCVACKRIGEGMDIGDLDSVAILYPKQSHIEITQMIFRAGRWNKYKPVWHVLFPMVSDEDYRGFYEVLRVMAMHDARISADAARIVHAGAIARGGRAVDTVPDLDVFSSTVFWDDFALLRPYFTNLALARRDAVPSYSGMRERNILLGLRTRREYEVSVAEDLRNPDILFQREWVSWYDFLGRIPEIQVDELARKCRALNLRSYAAYTERRAQDPEFARFAPELLTEAYGKKFANYADFVGIVRRSVRNDH